MDSSIHFGTAYLKILNYIHLFLLLFYYCSDYIAVVPMALITEFNKCFFICNWLILYSSFEEGVIFSFWCSGSRLSLCDYNSVLLIVKSFNLLAMSERFLCCVSFSSCLWNWIYYFSHCRIVVPIELPLTLEFESYFLKFIYSSAELLHVSILNNISSIHPRSKSMFSFSANYFILFIELQCF